MKTKLEWQVGITSTEKVDNLREWSAEVERGLLASEMIPINAHMATCSYLYGQIAYCVFKWETENEMVYEPNYQAS